MYLELTASEIIEFVNHRHGAIPFILITTLTSFFFYFALEGALRGVPEQPVNFNEFNVFCDYATAL